MADMSDTIGKADSKKEILDFLRIYNKSKGKTKKIKKDALDRLDRYVNVFIKILVVNCAEMLSALKLVTLTTAIFYTVYDIMVNGNEETDGPIFTKEMYQKFQNVLITDQYKKSRLKFNNKTILDTKIFDTKVKTLVGKIFKVWGITTNPKVSKSDQLIEFILMLIFEATGDCDIITTDILTDISNQEEFVKLDECLGSFGILGNDEITIQEKEE